MSEDKIKPLKCEDCGIIPDPKDKKTRQYTTSKGKTVCMKCKDKLSKEDL